MKKTAGIIGLLFMIVLSCLCAAGCSESSSGSGGLVGKWVQEGYTGNDAYMEFRSDGTIYYVTISNGTENPTKIGTYSTNGSNLTMNNQLNGQSQTFTYSLSGGKLILSVNGMSETYVKFGSGSGTNTNPNNNPSPLTPGL